MNPQDEYMHPVRAERGWSESYYFNFVDPEQEIGMFTRMGFRPGDGWADGLHALYLGGDRVAFTYGRKDLPELTDDLNVGGLSLDRVEPFQHYRVRYDGPAQDVAYGPVLMTRRRERGDNWYTPAQLTMAIDFHATSEPHYAGQGERGHFEQTGHATGEIAMGDERWNVDGYGVRDKSWGPRTWEGRPASGEGGGAPKAGPDPFVNWFSMNWGPDLALGCSCGRGKDGVMRGAGWFQRGREIIDLRDITIESAYQADSLLHTGMRLRGTAADGTAVDVEGTVMTICPTKIPMPQGATFVNEGLAKFMFEGRTGYGIAEYWHAVSLDA